MALLAVLFEQDGITYQHECRAIAPHFCMRKAYKSLVWWADMELLPVI
jgi:hypothetical protein